MWSSFTGERVVYIARLAPLNNKRWSLGHTLGRFELRGLQVHDRGRVFNSRRPRKENERKRKEKQVPRAFARRDRLGEACSEIPRARSQDGASVRHEQIVIACLIQWHIIRAVRVR